MYYVYMLRCSDNSLYTGSTSDIKKRLKEHFSKNSLAAKYTKSHSPIEVVALWECESKSDAMKVEYRIKTLTKPQKEEHSQEILVKKDLFSDIQDEDEEKQKVRIKKTDKRARISFSSKTVTPPRQEAKTEVDEEEDSGIRIVEVERDDRQQRTSRFFS